MRKYLVCLILVTSTMPLNLAFADAAPLKAVMQINSQNVLVIMRALRDGLEVVDQAQASGSTVDLKVVVYGSALDLFQKGTDPELNTAFHKMSSRPDVHFIASEQTLKRTGKGSKDLLPGFTVVPSGPYEVLRLEQAGYLYVKP